MRTHCSDADSGGLWLSDHAGERGDAVRLCNGCLVLRLHGEAAPPAARSSEFGPGSIALKRLAKVGRPPLDQSRSRSTTTAKRQHERRLPRSAADRPSPLDVPNQHHGRRVIRVCGRCYDPKIADIFRASRSAHDLVVRCPILTTKSYAPRARCSKRSPGTISVIWRAHQACRAP